MHEFTSTNLDKSKACRNFQRFKKLWLEIPMRFAMGSDLAYLGGKIDGHVFSVFLIEKEVLEKNLAIFWLESINLSPTDPI